MENAVLVSVKLFWFKVNNKNTGTTSMTARPLNSLPSECFPLTYHLNNLKSKS